MSRRTAAILWAIAIMLATGLYLSVPAPRHYPASALDGTYLHPCCGPLIFDNGALTAGTEHLRYTLGSDRSGPYILPDAYVGVVEGKGFAVLHDRRPVKLLPQHLGTPYYIEVPGPYGSYWFHLKRDMPARNSQ